jgi:hypothetical protein
MITEKRPTFTEALDNLEGAFEAALLAANRSDEYADLAGDGPYRDSATRLRRTLTNLARQTSEVIRHSHDWTGDDRCSICGADGRA